MYLSTPLERDLSNETLFHKKYAWFLITHLLSRSGEPNLYIDYNITQNACEGSKKKNY